MNWLLYFIHIVSNWSLYENTKYNRYKHSCRFWIEQSIPMKNIWLLRTFKIKRPNIVHYDSITTTSDHSLPCTLNFDTLLNYADRRELLADKWGPYTNIAIKSECELSNVSTKCSATIPKFSSFNFTLRVFHLTREDWLRTIFLVKSTHFWIYQIMKSFAYITEKCQSKCLPYLSFKRRGS